MRFGMLRDLPPRPADVTRVAMNREKWRETDTDPPALPSDAERLLDGIFGSSPYLSHLLLREPDLARAFFQSGPDEPFDALLTALGAESLGQERSALMRTLRRAKRQGALLIALADLGLHWSVPQTTMALSRLADAAIALSCRWLLRRAAEQGALTLPDLEQPEQGSGLLVLAMGKLGAFELNYSSDVDLILFYDEERVRYEGRRSMQEFFVRLTHDLAQLLDERTGDGYVFRIDLRLRPDPGSTPAALSLLGAETYYEGLGQNWERAAMIKARQVAGDPAAGARFFDLIKRFIWRRHLDFAALQDIHSIKRQIDARHGQGRIQVAGHDVKLGRGGIREIEFFAQTQQLIWGGREPGLRVSGTLAALTALAEARHVTTDTARDLTDCYLSLRCLEHRLQMLDDRQTHTLPVDPIGLGTIAAFTGFSDPDLFARATEQILRGVEKHYSRLFEHAPSLSGPGNLVFTGATTDPQTLKTLQDIGYRDAEMLVRAIRGWHHGRLRATRSARAREILTELTPRLLQALASTSDPDAAFLRFDRLLADLPVGLPLFALVANNPSLIDLLAEILGNAPTLAEKLIAHPHLLEDVLSGQFFETLPDCTTLTADLSARLVEIHDTEEGLNLARRWVDERKLRIGVQTLQGRLAAGRIGGHLSDIADAALQALQNFVERAFANAHGTLPGGGMAVVALGKLGGREMTASSDLDLILVFDLEGADLHSDGAKPLDGMTYATRLSQRFLAALTVQTAEGVLYTTDLRLRPSGNKGPIATSLAAFDSYQAQAAWTWEHMALTRARVVTGSPALRHKIDRVLQRTLTATRDPEPLRQDVAEMRRKLVAHHAASSDWEIKHRRGGLVDVEFITQYLQLRFAADHPSLRQSNLGAALSELGRLGLLPERDAKRLQAAWALWSSLQQILRLTQQGDFREEALTARVREILARAARCRDFPELLAVMARRAEQVSALYRRWIDHPPVKKRGSD